MTKGSEDVKNLWPIFRMCVESWGVQEKAQEVLRKGRRENLASPST